MEDILDLYAEPYQPAFPVICFDEVPYQLVSETKEPLPIQNGKPLRYDYEYRREGRLLRGFFASASPVPHQVTGTSLYA
jgi:hypothetical protein